MFLYNITYKIDKPVESDWLDWMKIMYLPKMMASGYFESYKMYKLLHIEDDGVTYSIQLLAKSISDIQQFLEKEAKLLEDEHNFRFKNRHVAFRTVLQEV